MRFARTPQRQSHLSWSSGQVRWGSRPRRSCTAGNPTQAIVIYGDEPTEPYNRVRLSGFLSGELDVAGAHARSRACRRRATWKHAWAAASPQSTANAARCSMLRAVPAVLEARARNRFATARAAHTGDDAAGRLHLPRRARRAEAHRAACAQHAARSCSAAACSASKPRAPCSVSIRKSASSSTTRGS